jgi:hypothetical protein
LRDNSGVIVAANDNWRSNQEVDIIATTVAPTNDLESAIVRGANNSTGIAVVEVYTLNWLDAAKPGSVAESFMGG